MSQSISFIFFLLKSFLNRKECILIIDKLTVLFFKVRDVIRIFLSSKNNPNSFWNSLRKPEINNILTFETTILGFDLMYPFYKNDKLSIKKGSLLHSD